MSQICAVHAQARLAPALPALLASTRKQLEMPSVAAAPPTPTRLLRAPSQPTAPATVEQRGRTATHAPCVLLASTKRRQATVRAQIVQQTRIQRLKVLLQIARARIVLQAPPRQRCVVGVVRLLPGQEWWQYICKHVEDMIDYVRVLCKSLTTL